MAADANFTGAPYYPPPHPELNDPKFKTCVPDARYHNMNATNWCFATYVDYKKCCRLLGDKGDCCARFEKIFRSICPNAWVDRWEEQIEEGTFPVDLPEQKKR